MTDKAKSEIIISTVASYMGLPAENMKKRSRKREIVTARFYAIYFLRKHTCLSLIEIGSLFGRLDHSSVLNAVTVTGDRIKLEKSTRGDINSLCEILSRVLKSYDKHHVRELIGFCSIN
jgi:chromosomal replication initiator protein